LASPTTRRVRIGIVIGVVALCVLAALTEDVVTNDPLTRFDVSSLETLQRHTTPAGMTLFTVISRFGSPFAMTLLALAGTVYLAARREWIVLWGWVVAFAGMSVLDYWLKLAIHRPRPPAYATMLLDHPSWSFPSGHAMGSLVGYGMLAYVILLLGHGSRRTRLIVGGAAALVIAAIGISRLYLGVHYISDVVGGYAAGLVWLSACVSGVEIARRRQRRRALRLNPTA
jgi:undecaprenyl-diphosphatase